MIRVLIALSLLGVSMFSFRNTVYAQEFFKLQDTHEPSIVFEEVKVEEVPAQDLTPAVAPENSSEEKVAETTTPSAEQPKPQLDYSKCEPERYLRADNGECMDKPKPAATPVATAPKPTSKPAAPATSMGSGCDWLRGELSKYLAPGDIQAAMYIAQKESSCNQAAVNKSSGACNVFQEYTCGKWGGRSNLAAHIQGANTYAKNRYGGWWGAYNFWINNHRW